MKNSTRSILPALLAVSGGLASTPANSLEIGEVNVESKLGQPLRASISYALGPDEYLADYCVSLSPRFASSGLPTVNRARISISSGVITLRGYTAIREPLMAMRLKISCPYTPKITREYMLFVDPALPAETRAAPAQSTVAAATPVVATSVAAPQSSTPPAPAPRTNRAPVNRPPINASERYRVQVGDSLSAIAQRIENRSVGLWSAVEQIFAANPDAFIHNDPNQLKAGSWLLMPDFGPQTGFAAATTVAQAPVTETLAPVEVATALESTEAPDLSAIYDAAFTTADVGIETAPPAVEAPEVAEVPDTTAQASNEADDTAVLQPAEIIFATDLDVPTTATNPNVPSASIIVADDTSESSINWLLWLNVAGIALLAGLFFFGRSGRSPVASTAARPQRRRTDNNIENVEALPKESTVVEDDEPTQENLALDPNLMPVPDVAPGADVELDADLEIGTGLQQATSVDVAQDFGFAVTTHLDLELPELSAMPVEDDKASHTDIIAAPTLDENSILDSEVLPADDEYDMSVIMDATKMQMPEEVTERDLKAVVVDTSNETMISDHYTLNREMDYDILEQDYQEELTATQALNLEIEKAAAEIAKQAGKDKADATDRSTDGKTASLPLATVTELDVTEKMITDENTVEMPSKSDGKAG